MIDLAPSNKVRQLQAMLFPVQPIPSGTLPNSLQGPSQELQIPQTGRLGIFSVPLKQREPKDAIRALLDARSVVDGITQEIARWPTECQVIPERIRHIEYNPPTPEPLYLSSGKEPKPRPICDELGSVIFRYSPSSVTNYFSRSCVGGSTVLPLAAETLANTVTCSTSESKDIDEFDCKTGIVVLAEAPRISETNTDLHFESRFESGNLGKVVKITDTYYQLHLRKDLYTQRHTQWFYFRITNTRSKTTYRLSIVNLYKEESLYNDGLRPLLYSMEDARTKAVGWRRCGDNISYYKNNDSCNDEEKEKHTLTFNVSFPHDRDTVYLAHCYPYTYSDLQEYLAKIVADPVKARFTKLRLLCRTLAGNGVYYLTITAPSYAEELRRKKGVVITARVHPGETPSSWTMKGIIDYLTGDSNQARELRERFVFKLVPMLNPDGVIVGNNRCSLSGKDLNRQYRTVMRESYPSVWHTKLMIRRLLEECGIAIYCDLHAHSRKHNIFAYGCENKRNGFYARLSEQIFPLLLHKNAASKFSFENCKFHIEKGKEGTGRVVVWSMGVLNSYTIEASMGGSKMGSRSGTHFSTQDYEQIGKAFCETLLDFSDQDPTKERLRNKILTRLVKEGSTAEEPINIDLTDYSSDEGDSSSSSTLDEDIIDSSDYSWDVEDYSQIHRRYPCVPPSSPTYFPSSPIGRIMRRARKGTETERNYLERRKLLVKLEESELNARRAVLDLPVTDPGSDLCDVNDSTEEGFTRERGGIMHRRRDQIDIKQIDRERENGVMSKQEYRDECLVLPAIVRPRSLSFGEDLIARKNSYQDKQRMPCVRLARRLRTTSPVLPSQDVQIRLTSLRQQIWLGVPFENENKNIKDFHSLSVRNPISWGVSNIALTQFRMDNKILLNSCSEKLESLNYVERRNDTRKSRRRSRRKQLKTAVEVVPSEPEVVRQEGAPQKYGKKRKSRLKWQKAVNLNTRIKEIRTLQSSFLSITADSLKLHGTAGSAKSPVKQQKSKSKENLRRGGIVATAVTRIARNNVEKLQSFVEPLCNSSSSEDASTDVAKQKGTKAKQKKKKQQKKIKTADSKKRPISAGILRNT